MITGFILDVVYAVSAGLTSILTLLPNATISTDAGSAFGTLGYYLGIANIFFPVTAILVMIAFLTTMIVMVFSLKFIRFGLSMIPFFGG